MGRFELMKYRKLSQRVQPELYANAGSAEKVQREFRSHSDIFIHIWMYTRTYKCIHGCRDACTYLDTHTYPCSPVHSFMLENRYEVVKSKQNCRYGIVNCCNIAFSIKAVACGPLGHMNDIRWNHMNHILDFTAVKGCPWGNIVRGHWCALAGWLWVVLKNVAKMLFTFYWIKLINSNEFLAFPKNKYDSNAYKTKFVVCIMRCALSASFDMEVLSHLTTEYKHLIPTCKIIQHRLT